MAALEEAAASTVVLEATVLKEALMRSAADMKSAKAGLMPAETRVDVLEVATLDNGTERAHIRGGGREGWVSIKFLGDRTRRKGPLFLKRETSSGASFLRGFVGAGYRSDASTPLVVVLHGTGYNAGVWLPTMDELHDLSYERNVGFEVILLEWTGHGRSRRCPGSGVDDARYDLATLARDDVYAVLDAMPKIAGRRTYAVAHSIGAQVVVHAELDRPGCFDGISTFEPMIMPRPPLAAVPKAAAGAKVEVSPFIKTTLKRKNGWASFEAAAAYFQSTALGVEWEAKALAGYLQHGVLEQPDGTYALAMDPETEACVYLNSGAHGGPRAYGRLSEIECEFHAAAGARSTMSLTHGKVSFDRHIANMRKIAEAVANPLDGELGKDVNGAYHGPLLVLDDANHNIIQEDAEWAARFIDASLARIAANLDKK